MDVGTFYKDKPAPIRGRETGIVPRLWHCEKYDNCNCVLSLEKALVMSILLYKNLSNITEGIYDKTRTVITINFLGPNTSMISSIMSVMQWPRYWRKWTHLCCKKTVWIYKALNLNDHRLRLTDLTQSQVQFPTTAQLTGVSLKKRRRCTAAFG